MTDIDQERQVSGEAQASETGTSVPATEHAGRKQEKDTSLFRWLLETIVLVALAFALAQGIKTFIVQPFVIPTGSMIPTIEIGDRVLADKLVYRFFREPQRGDIVVFSDPNDQYPQLIKRVVAVGGETIDIRDGTVYIDDEPLDEPYVHGRSTDPGSVELPRTLSPNEVWLMGDNRPESGDSRFFGPRPTDTVEGRAFWTYWPLDRFGTLE